MSKSKTAKRIQEVTGWGYVKALHFERTQRTDGMAYAEAQGLTLRDALLAMAQAETEDT